MGRWWQKKTALQRFPRTTTSVRVLVSTIDPEIDPATGQRFFRSMEETAANLSRGGAFVRSPEPLSAGRRVALSLHLSNDPADAAPLHLMGRVVWSQRALALPVRRRLEMRGYGVEFTGGSREELTRLERYLVSLTTPRARVHAPTPRILRPAP